MRIVIFGAPASGKGTQGKRIADRLGIPHVSTGDMLRAMREEPGEVGDSLRAIPPHAFASDDLILRALREELAKPAYARGVVLEGFPRTLPQAQAMLEMGLRPDWVVSLDVDLDLVAERAVGRRTHTASGRSYHVKFNPPRVPDTDDVTGEPLVQRRDDHAEVVAERLRWFDERTVPAIDWMRAACMTPPGATVWSEVDASGSLPEVSARIDAALAAVLAARPQAAARPAPRRPS